jgi:hopene-associated glycosyltransferase HpnB
MHLWLTLAGALSLLAWLYLLFFHGRFWRCSERLDAAAIPLPTRWPAVAAVVPARDEEETIEAVLESLLTQDYPGPLSVTLVDDRSSDRTAALAAAVGARHAGRATLSILPGTPLPPGWSGKLWALNQGIDQATRMNPDATFIFLSDADIAHDPAMLRLLVGKALADKRDLVSLMAQLNCATGWERLLIPAFIFFFQKLYPFPQANDDGSRTAAAAGGCVLIRREALERIGGIGAIRGALIDDCTLARAIKTRGGGLWLGLADGMRSLRVYRSLRPIWMMVARSAFTQLRYSALLLLGTLLGMILIYLVPPLLLLTLPLHGSAAAAALGGLAWALMAAAYLPTLRYHRLPPARMLVLALSLPVATLLYLAMTIDSARRHWWGSGSRWKGRDYGSGKQPAEG